MLKPEYQPAVLPIKKENLELLYELKHSKYQIYFLSNLTEATYVYLKDILDDFDGGIYSWQEHYVKPQKEIYERLWREIFSQKARNHIF